MTIKHANWDVLRSQIVDADLCDMNKQLSIVYSIDNATDVNDTWGELLTLLEQFKSPTIPRIKVKANRSYARDNKEVRHLSHILHEQTKYKSIPDILTDGISEYSDTAAIADLFNKYFQSVFNKDISHSHINVENTRTKNISYHLMKLIIYRFKTYYRG